MNIFTKVFTFYKSLTVKQGSECASLAELLQWLQHKLVRDHSVSVNIRV